MSDVFWSDCDPSRADQVAQKEGKECGHIFQPRGVGGLCPRQGDHPSARRQGVGVGHLQGDMPASSYRFIIGPRNMYSK